MSRILVVYGTTDGQTRRIAERIADVFEQLGLQVVLLDAKTAPADFSLVGIDAAVVLGSVRMGKHQQELADFVLKRHLQLDAIPNAFLSVSLSAARLHKPSAKREVDKTFHHFIDRTHWKPDMRIPIAGALVYTKYDFWTRQVMKLISWMTGGETDASRDYEYTDWDAVGGFALRFAGALAKAPELQATMEDASPAH